MDDDNPERSHYLKVTFRRLQRHEVEGGRVLGVFCPRLTRAIDVRECRSCEHCQGLCIDPSDRETFLRCAWQGAAAGDPDSTSASQAEAQAAGESPARRTKLASVMAKHLLCVTPETGLSALAALLLEHGISAAPVVDQSGAAIGIVSKTDLLRHCCSDEPGPAAEAHEMATPGGLALEIGPGLDRERMLHGTVREIMTHLVYTLGAEASISRAAALMAYEGVHRIVVAAPDGKALGVVSALDILRFIAREDGYVVPELTRQQSRTSEEHGK